MEAGKRTEYERLPFRPASASGAASPFQYAGVTDIIGPPVTGTYATNVWVTDLTGTPWVCTVGGTPGTWAEVSGGLFLPLPAGQPLAGNVPTATGVGEAVVWGPGGGTSTSVSVDGTPVPTLNISSAALVNKAPSVADTYALAATNYDPLFVSTTSALTPGVIFLQRLHLDAAATVSSVLVSLGTQITGATTGNLVGLYDDNGNLLAVSADQGAAWAGAVGMKTVSFITPVALQPGWYNVALLTNGTTGAGFYRSSSASGLQNVNCTGGAGNRFRFGTYLTGQTTLPNALTMASIASSTSFILTPWVGLL